MSDVAQAQARSYANKLMSQRSSRGGGRGGGGGGGGRGGGGRGGGRGGRGGNRRKCATRLYVYFLNHLVGYTASYGSRTPSNDPYDQRTLFLQAQAAKQATTSSTNQYQANQQGKRPRTTSYTPSNAVIKLILCVFNLF